MLTYGIPHQSKATKTKSKTTGKFLFNNKLQPKNCVVVKKLSQDQSFA